MTFSDIKTAYDANCKYSRKTGFENKQRINLSERAYSILKNDMEFYPFVLESDKDLDKIPSTVINYIFTQCKDSAQSSIALRLKQRQWELEELLKPVDKYIITKLLQEQRKNLTTTAENRCQSKGHSIIFRINMDNLEYLASDDGQEESSFYQDNAGKYIKAVLEEYAELPYVHRERLFYTPILDKIDTAISQKNQLKITLKSMVAKGAVRKHINIYIRPYQVSTDTEGLYNYLVGYIRSSDSNNWQVGAIRISSILKCSVTGESAFLSAATQKEIKRLLALYGCQYLSSAHDDLQKIVVQFTPAGEKMYRKMLHLRPQCVQQHPNLVYEFRCSQWQALNYFFKYGRDVKILEPQKLVRSFQKRYQDAAKQYE